jgi:1,4-alpha-glucan branching enzyme
MIGYFSLILHAHLPFVRHPEYPEFLEEDWLYEAITEVYLPLLFIFQTLHETGMKPRLALNLSPPLCEMLADEMLQTRYTRHLENLLELAEKEVHRTEREAMEFHDVAKMYAENLRASLDLWNDRYNRDLVGAFRRLQDEGAIEIITCGATHGFLPLISTHEARRAQVQIAVNNYKKHFGRVPRGIWLPECAYEPGVENLLKEAGIEYFISDTHAILYGDPRPRYGVHSPVFCPNGTGVFARDVETSQQVWSAEIGYPGNDVYREFYRDIGWDLPIDYLKPHLHEDGNRRHLGLKYHRITGRGVPQQNKAPYIPALAREKAAENAAHFIGERIKQAHVLRAAFDGRPPLVVSPYDAELFGHWWFEGPQFLDFFFRKLHFDQADIAAITPGDFLDSGLPIQRQQPTSSSWGENGYYKVWLNDQNSWMYPYQHDAERRMTRLVNREVEARGRGEEGTRGHGDFEADVTASPRPSLSASQTAGSVSQRLLKQLARELLLAESSDWAFQIYQGTTVEYSTRRFQSHIHRFDLLAKMLETGDVDHELLAEIERRDNIFGEIDYLVYGS